MTNIGVYWAFGALDYTTVAMSRTRGLMGLNSINAARNARCANLAPHMYVINFCGNGVLQRDGPPDCCSALLPHVYERPPQRPQLQLGQRARHDGGPMWNTIVLPGHRRPGHCEGQDLLACPGCLLDPNAPISCCQGQPHASERTGSSHLISADPGKIAASCPQTIMLMTLARLFRWTSTVPRLVHTWARYVKTMSSSLSERPA